MAKFGNVQILKANGVTGFIHADVSFSNPETKIKYGVAYPPSASSQNDVCCSQRKEGRLFIEWWLNSDFLRGAANHAGETFFEKISFAKSLKSEGAW